MGNYKLILILFIGVIMLACAKDSDQYPNPPLGNIQGKLVYEEFDFYDYEFGSNKYDLKVLDASGTYTIPSITRLNRLSPIWSSEGDAIWYLSSTNYSYTSFGGYENVAVKRILNDGSQDSSLLQSNWLEEGGVYDAIAISPDGKYIALANRSRLELYEVVDKLQLKLLKILETSGRMYNRLQWSPDSKSIAYFVINWPNEWDLLIYNLESNVVRNVLPDKSVGPETTWAYSSDRIAFIGDNDIFLVGVDGTNLVNLTNTPDIEEKFPAFSPVEDKLIYANVDSLNQVILLDMTSGKKEVIMDDNGDVSYYTGNCYDTFTWSKDGSAFLFRFASSSQSGLRRFKFEGHQIENIYNGSIDCFDWYEAP